MTGTADLTELRRRMTGAFEAFKKELSGLRTGRASVSLLEPIQVEAYGSHMPLSQLSTVGAPEARMLTVQVWDKSMVKAVEKAIREANIGVNPMVEGQLIRCPLPPLTEERRKELVKLAHKFAEHARVAVRNVRRDGMEALKQMEKDHKITEDEHRKRGVEIQKVTDEFVKSIDDTLAAKEKETMHV
jgi:ribosome recycling factor